LGVVSAGCAGWTVGVCDLVFAVRVVNPADDPRGPLDVARRFGDEALMRTMLAGPAGQQAQIATLLVRDGDRVLELTFRSLVPEPGSPEESRLHAAMAAFVDLAPAKFTSS
ncbi:hypothetical protein, partial [Streptomyces sp. NPDC047123]|uniref:hypothetical protein n=1 Tax=Streptomyces sp. NPDC047123 TaxID=3155622 RepID=UPI0033F9DA98